MANKWTDEQKRAIETRGRNLLVAAAAGSGKTAVLVERIIKMITDPKKPVDIDRLLVVTFTSAAASEMRERIGEAISKELEKYPNSSVLARQLTLLGGANITTMHSFCLEVIKNNFHEIDLDPGFRIGDQTECEILKNDVLDDLFEEKYIEAKKEFLDLVESYGGSKNDDKLKSLILKIYSFSMSGPWPEKWLKDKAEAFNINSREELYKTAWINIIKENVSLKVESIYNAYKNAAELCHIVEGMDKYLENVDEDLAVLDKIQKSFEGDLDDIAEAFECVKFGRLKTIKKGTVDEESQNIFKAARDKAKKDIAKIAGELNIGSVDDIIEQCRNLYPLMMELSNTVLQFEEQYKAKKKERSMLDFNDMEHICLEILTEKSSGYELKPSKVALNYREKFEEVFVDEYQDSNNVQETIINMVSRKDCEKPNVFMVGDVKQSIYRFRQAKPELFLDKYNTYTDSKDADSSTKNEKITLFKNFRSRKEILDAANFIFYNIMSESVGELDYTEREALNLGADYKEVNKDNVYELSENEFSNFETAGDVELHILDLAGEAKEESQDNEGDGEEQSEEDEENLDAMQYESRLVAKRINSLIHGEKPYLIYDKHMQKYRKIRYKDIVILLRTVKSWSEVLVDELSMAGIPVYADTGSGYFDTVEIRTVMSLLHVIDNPLQDIHMIAVLRSPVFAFSMDMLSDLRLLVKDMEDQKYYYDIVKEVASGQREASTELKEKCSYVIEKISMWREKSEYMPIDEFIYYLIMDTSYYGFVGAMSNGVKRQANLRILFQRAKQFEGTSLKGLFNFITFINKLRKSSGDMGSAKILGENEDVVRIMSIHKSKGLEFPVVILAGCGKQFNLMDLNDDVLLHDELGYGPNYVDLENRTMTPSIAKTAIKEKQKLEIYSEEIRILYVALTRAKEKLIMTGRVNDFEKQVEKYASAASSVTEYNTISPREILNSKCYLDWIAMSVARHKDGALLRNARNDIRLRDDYSKWNVHLWIKSDLTVDEKNDVVDNIDENILKDTEAKIDEEIRNRLEFKYDYRDIVSLPSNVSVSDLKKAAFEDEEPVFKLYESEYVRKPKFLSEEKGLTAAERGTAMHFVMQHLDLNNVSTTEKIDEQIKSMAHDELLGEEEAASVNRFKVFKFFKSKIGKEMLMAHRGMSLLQRELAFVTEIPAQKLLKEELSSNYSEEKVRLQGIIDCFFESRGKLILLDYKTDYVEEGDEEKIVDRYKIQMEYYSEALEKMIGRKVDEIYLYLFRLDKEVKVEI
ncbi:helicase-exonuclease AddAB subunit AddA [Inconstantimicrobium porci]|uniref:helicase-exonuclease AddAB subunit AddA n=1 Tax=Inconstantimicrobium porci TaxID=2652291 RepID=UPI002409AE0F|nr:helicase-exonuclease AddAB subunit AddA [Inconstantimicrobium porci]MDD6769532.1 helicase-exonuclease AddAB subunit AddA [Inconstantimicrobium porci]